MDCFLCFWSKAVGVQIWVVLCFCWCGSGEYYQPQVWLKLAWGEGWRLRARDEGEDVLGVRCGELLVRSNFLPSIIINHKIMKGVQLALLVLLLAQAVNSVDYGGISNVDQFSLKPIKKGLTYQATIWPNYNSNWAGRFSCNNCNPFEGDQTCDKNLPLVCITSHKALQRPFYRVAVEYTPFAVVDGGFYDGWTGGVIQVTVPVRGYDLIDYNTGNNICKGYFGDKARWAKFNDGFYLPYMNQRPIKAWGFWNWASADLKSGGWNFWGYFNHHYRGRAWVYVDGQPNGNCGI